MIQARSKKLFNLCLKARKLFECAVEVDGFIFHPSTKEEYSRYVSLLSKEPGTIDWIERNLRLGDVFYDIGANLGLFSLYAARKGALVYAFEPHKMNFCGIIKNAERNHLQNQIVPCGIALGDKSSLDLLYYKSTNSGSSMNQLGEAVNLYDERKIPAFKELLHSASLDDLIAYGLPAPTLVKMDVDGNEIKILHGMDRLLTSPNKPRSLSIEINKGFKEEIDNFMSRHGYKKISVNYSSSEKIWKEKYGEDAPHNGIYEL
jgi:FkbM family methyltransferase